MRRIAVLFAAVFAAASFAPAPVAVAAEPTGPKVAIIVGPVHDGTAQYQGYGDLVAAEARKYTDNVVKVYSPNATWPKVVAAVTGASVVVNIGHGNGYPSPYGFDSTYTRQNGFGLNYDNNGDGKLSNYELRYYGEKYIRTLKMAPNAVVLLFHMCYSAGNQEPGGPEPTLAVARQRADNFASGFLAAGAKGVFAIAHSGGDDAYYMRALFTTRQTLADVFLRAREFHNHVLAFPSVRTPGAVELLDPDTSAPSGFYRAFTGFASARTEDAIAGPYADTGTDPASLAVPGNASPSAPGVPLFASPGDAAAGAPVASALSGSEHVRVTGQESATAPDGSPVFAVSADGVGGFMAGSSLTPRDSAAPRLWEVLDGSGAFSPDGDGASDTMPISLRLSEPSDWSVQITSGWGPPLASAAGFGDTASITWAPAPGDVADGVYQWRLSASDALGNGPSSFRGDITVDRGRPVLSVAGDPAAVLPLSPNGDLFRDTAVFAAASSETGTVRAVIRSSATGDVVASLDQYLFTSGTPLVWDGRDDAGALVPDGGYAVTLTAADPAGNTSDPVERLVSVYRALGFTTASPSLFFPQDGDALAARATVGFTLAYDAQVSWTIQDAAGRVVRTMSSGEVLAGGVHAFAWDGRSDAGALVPRGTYRSVVTASDGAQSATQASSVLADAFRIAASDTTPGRGQRITVTVTSAEPLSSAPRVTVSQPGRAAWSVGTVRLTATTYRAVVVLRTGAQGVVRLKAAARDKGGRTQYSVLSLPLH
jgi:flagellar hook assembly protein FlgD